VEKATTDVRRHGWDASGLARLLAIPLALGVATALLGGHVGVPESWQAGGMVFIASGLVVVVADFIRERYRARRASVRTESVLAGRLELRSGTLVLCDGKRPELRITVEGVPVGVWTISSLFEYGEEGPFLNEVVLQAAGPSSGGSVETTELVVESNEFLLVDSAALGDGASASGGGDGLDDTVGPSLVAGHGWPNCYLSAVMPPHWDGVCRLTARRDESAMRIVLSLQ
jgi:hypothetical protein